jgi:3-oxoacyl-[acyl-carrier protein] reductase
MEQKVPALLVTGAGRGLGRGIAVEAASRGYSVIINYAHNSGSAEETAALCLEAAKPELRGGQSFPLFKADISVPDDRKALLEFSFSRFPDLYGLVNNAGVAPEKRKDLLEIDEQSWDRVLGINLKGPFYLTSMIASRWLETGSKGKKIIFISSISAESASVGRGEYCISKAGIAMASKLFAARLAPEGIQVYEVRPGIMATDMTAGVKEKYDKLLAEGLVPQGRWGRPEDTGKAVCALLDGSFDFSNGNIFYVDGGFHIPRL